MATDVFLPLVIIGGAMVFMVFVVQRQMQARMHDRELLNRERLAAIAAGRTQEPDGPASLNPPSRPRVRNALQDAVGFIVMGMGITAAFVIAQSHLWGWGVFVVSIGVANLIYWFMGGKRDWEQQARVDDEIQQAYVRRLRGGALDDPHAGTST